MSDDALSRGKDHGGRPLLELPLWQGEGLPHKVRVRPTSLPLPHLVGPTAVFKPGFPLSEAGGHMQAQVGGQLRAPRLDPLPFTSEKLTFRRTTGEEA